MMLKNVYLLTAGFLLGVLCLAVVLAIAVIRVKSASYKEQLQFASAIKLKDVDGKTHIVHNIKTFTQAFYCVFAFVYLFFVPNAFKLLYRNRDREKKFFVVVCWVAVVLLTISAIGVCDIIDCNTRWKELSDWKIFTFD